VAARHGGDEGTEEGAAVEGDGRIAELPETEKLYYEEPERTEFEAVVLDVLDREDGYDVVLDQTMFYPEGGGQPADTGTLSGDEVTVDVTDVQERNGVVLHRTGSDPGKGEFVRGTLDSTRRKRLMAHHTATHIVGHAARQVLGEHVRQAGAQKGTDSSRFDIRHYERISREELKRIERVANGIVTDNVAVKQEWPDRRDAEDEHGFDLYQGGIPPGETLRLIHVGDDVQACGGTHVLRTGDIGAIKILSTERVQDGIERLVFAAGDAAVEATQRTEDALYATAETFDVSPQEVPDTAARFFREWKERGKRIEELKEQLAAVRAKGGTEGETVDLGGGSAVIQRVDGDMDELRATANALVEEGSVAVLGSAHDGATFVVAVPEGIDINAGAVVSDLAGRVGGGGGGPPGLRTGRRPRCRRARGRPRGGPGRAAPTLESVSRTVGGSHGGAGRRPAVVYERVPYRRVQWSFRFSAR